MIDFKDFPKFDGDYYFLYEEIAKENEELRKRINYPKIEIGEILLPFGKKRISASFLLGDNLTSLYSMKEIDACLEKSDKSYKQYLTDYLLRELGYKYFKRAYEYWENNEREK